MPVIKDLHTRTLWEATARLFRVEGIIRDDFTAAIAISKGIPAQVAKTLEQEIGANFRRKLIPDRTLARRLAQSQPLTADEGDRILRTAQVVTYAYQVFGSPDKARLWLLAPKRSLDGRTPLDIAITVTGASVVRNLLGQIDAGYCF